MLPDHKLLARPPQLRNPHHIPVRQLMRIRIARLEETSESPRKPSID